MTGRQFLQSFEIMALKYINLSDKPYSIEVENWLNIGLDRYIKTRYSGQNPKGEGFEQSEKRQDDLAHLLNEEIYSNDSIQHQGLIDVVIIPNDFWFSIRESAFIIPNCYNKCYDLDGDGRMQGKFTYVIESTQDELNNRLVDTLSEHRWYSNEAHPLRARVGNKIKLYNDGNYHCIQFLLTYMHKPLKIDVNDKLEYTGMPESTHLEIVQIAVQSYIENINQLRVQTHLSEILTME